MRATLRPKPLLNNLNESLDEAQLNARLEVEANREAAANIQRDDRHTVLSLRARVNYLLVRSIHFR
jgi:hypothetical protein